MVDPLIFASRHATLLFLALLKIRFPWVSSQLSLLDNSISKQNTLFFYSTASFFISPVSMLFCLPYFLEYQFVQSNGEGNKSYYLFSK